MTNNSSTNILRQTKRLKPTKFPEARQAVRVVRGLSSLKERSIATGNIYVSMHPPARTSLSQTGTPGASRSQALAGGLRAAVAVHVIQRAVPSALVPASTAIPGQVGLSSADLSVLAA